MALPPQAQLAYRYTSQLSQQMPVQSAAASSLAYRLRSPLPYNNQPYGTVQYPSMPPPVSSSSNSGPFVQSTHGHPGFNPVKLGLHSDNRVPKPPKPPDKPLQPYMRYSRKVWDQVKNAHQDSKLWEIGKIIGQMWRELPEADKQIFTEEYELEKAEYAEAMKAYHNSPAYQAFIAAKGRAQQAQEERDAMEKTMGPKSKDARISIQPAEDEDVPAAVIECVEGLQEKLESELEQIEDKFKTKKRKFIESSDTFKDDLKKACEKKVDREMYLQLLEKAQQQLQEHLQRQKAGAEKQPQDGGAPSPGDAAAPPAATAEAQQASDEESHASDDRTASENTDSAADQKKAEEKAEPMEVSPPAGSDEKKSGEPAAAESEPNEPTDTHAAEGSTVAESTTDVAQT
ncbi:PREDICTED: SWI/SNF-related matrix-associated actin-dependent regulator of chromatin subfamily E member 1-like [Priapulus caudatus]|uniref:SWI/SNF-related matrix-associated actin-dependent regulator of chromatin subfamily E member 1-like n=1 Tax=Priapulus caudatus TaxID=37621 RepID=A0ABM1ETJ8_PRICU|nr:PREDICTED: SWI/SNF-related matrix-associated actin-dependent regulator of chromatin subfamily E member 1-like [Priapulus caudatus]